jgi:hypothetical protein
MTYQRGGCFFFFVLASATIVSGLFSAEAMLTLNGPLLRRALAALLPQLNLLEPVLLLLVDDEVLRVGVADPFERVQLGWVVVGEDVAL